MGISHEKRTESVKKNYTHVGYLCILSKGREQFLLYYFKVENVWLKPYDTIQVVNILTFCNMLPLRLNPTLALGLKN